MCRLKIIVDAFGGDHAPLEILKGCAQAVEELNVDILVTGKKEEIQKIAKENAIPFHKIEIVDAPDIITMDDSPKEITKSKSNSSMAIGMKLLADGKGDAFVSAGNSGALVMGTTLIVKRIKGVKRLAFAPVMPKKEGFFMLIDGGANVDCRPEMLQQFGIMGSIYMEKVMGIKNPRVGLANVGTEEHKGGEMQHEAFRLLKATDINFIGNIEGRDIPDDAADVVVADGFTGNMILKLYEGVALTLMGKIKGILQKNIKNKLAAAMILPDMKQLKQQIDYNEYGGAPIIGAAKPVFKVHGSAKAKTVKNAIRLTKSYVEGDVVGEISRSIKNFETILEQNI